jgi:hypothetical protein
MPAVFAVFVVAGVFAAGWFWLHRDSAKDTQIKNSNAEFTSFYDGKGGGAKKSIDEKLFTFSLPEDWKEISRANDTVKFIEWQSTKKDTTARSMKLYIDYIPQGTNGNAFAVNKLVPVQVVNNRILPGQVSGQCNEFNTSQYQSGAKVKNAVESAPAKWQEANFNCDLGNFLRNVVGTAMVGGDYKTKLKAKDGSEHTFFFVYTDHTINPDVQIMTQAIQSFEMK